MKEELFHSMAEVERDHWWFAGRRRIVEHVLSGLELPADARILELGCGTGGNLDLLSRFGKVRAVELDDTARAYAQGRGRVEVVEGSLPDGVPFEDASFDLIVLLDVLEHVERDRESLTRIESLLAPGGRLLLTVPALRMLWSEHDEEHHHHRRYHRGELVEMVRAAGLQVRVASYYNTWLFPLVAAARGWNRLTGRKAEADLEVPAPPVNRTLESIFASERHVVTKWTLPVGVSLLLVAQRRA